MMQIINYNDGQLIRRERERDAETVIILFTPSALITSRLIEFLGDKKEPYVMFTDHDLASQVIKWFVDFSIKKQEMERGGDRQTASPLRQLFSFTVIQLIK